MAWIFLKVACWLLVVACILTNAESQLQQTRCHQGNDWFQFNGHCYYWSSRTEGWFGAEKHCQQLGGHLASIGSRRENNFLHALSQCVNPFWIGMVKSDVRQRTFVWWDDAPNNYTEMLTIQSQSYLDCVYVNSETSAKWFNNFCQNLNNYVCQVPIAAPSEPRGPSAEESAGSEGRIDEGRKDCPSDWLHIENNCYFVSSERTNYFNAQLSCESKAANVAIVQSHREQMLITMVLGCSTEAWIGLEKAKPCITNPSQPSCWLWMDGSPLNFTSWASGYPHASSVKEVECATTEGKWKTTNCYYEYRYICKKK